MHPDVPPDVAVRAPDTRTIRLTVELPDGRLTTREQPAVGWRIWGSCTACDQWRYFDFKDDRVAFDAALAEALGDRSPVAVLGRSAAHEVALEGTA